LNVHVQRCGISPQGAIQGVTQMNTRKLAIVSMALAGVLAAASVEARGRDDVQFSVTIGGPAWGVHPVPVYRPGFVAPAYGHGHGHGYGRHERSYREPRRWDVDGDGVPNRYDRVYNPRWDRDGDGVPNRYDRYDNSRHGRGSRW
jgi:hypothetical protein